MSKSMAMPMSSNTPPTKLEWLSSFMLRLLGMTGSWAPAITDASHCGMVRLNPARRYLNGLEEWPLKTTNHQLLKSIKSIIFNNGDMILGNDTSPARFH